MIKEIYKAIQTAIATNATAIRWVDFNLGQLDQETPPVSWPCVLVGFGAAEYEQLGLNTDVGTQNVEIVVGFKLRERTHSKAADAFQAEALTHLDTVDAVRLALKSLTGDTFTDMQLKGTSNDQRADYRVYRLQFTVVDYPAAPDSPYQPWDEDTMGPLDFCVHPNIDN